MNTTTITITDPELLAQLAAAEGQIVFRGPTGEAVKTVATVSRGLPPGVKSPFTDEQIEEARKSPNSGITLAEFWKRMEQRGEWR